MSKPTDSYIFRVLSEIKAVYEADGKGAVYVRMSDDSGIDPNKFSKWLSADVNKRETPRIEHAPAIFSLYARVTGKPLDFPVVNKDEDPSVRRVLTAMERLDDTRRQEVAKFVEAYALANSPTRSVGT